MIGLIERDIDVIDLQIRLDGIENINNLATCEGGVIQRHGQVGDVIDTGIGRGLATQCQGGSGVCGLDQGAQSGR